MQGKGDIRGDYFIDRLGAWFEVLLAATSLGIVIFRHKADTDILLACLYGIEIVGAFAIMRSKLGPMRVALWLFTLRFAAGFAYVSVIHWDRLASSTLGFPFVVMIYCWARVRALKVNP